MKATVKYRMPFGKHKGMLLESIPLEYLLWLQHYVEMREPLKSAVQREIGLRQEEERMRRSRVFRNSGLTKDKVDRLFRELSLEYHPDRGGSVDAMKAIEKVKKLLLEQMGE